LGDNWLGDHFSVGHVPLYVAALIGTLAAGDLRSQFAEVANDRPKDKLDAVKNKLQGVLNSVVELWIDPRHLRPTLLSNEDLQNLLGEKLSMCRFLSEKVIEQLKDMLLRNLERQLMNQIQPLLFNDAYSVLFAIHAFRDLDNVMACREECYGALNIQFPQYFETKNAFPDSDIQARIQRGDVTPHSDTDAIAYVNVVDSFDEEMRSLRVPRAYSVFSKVDYPPYTTLIEDLNEMRIKLLHNGKPANPTSMKDFQQLMGQIKSYLATIVEEQTSDELHRRRVLAERAYNTCAEIIRRFYPRDFLGIGDPASVRTTAISPESAVVGKNAAFVANLFGGRRALSFQEG
jgi:hypothetical protein